jgi:hypothetical protein
MEQVKGAGIILTDSKQFTLDWGMQPDSYPGRALGIYGIQCIPFTDIARVQIPEGWSADLVTPSSESGLAYSITPKLIDDMVTGTYATIPVYNSGEWNAINFNPKTEGTFWSMVGLKMLLFSSAISNVQAQKIYHYAVNNQLSNYSGPQAPVYPIVKQFDSFSNTLYWMIDREKMSSAGTNVILTTTHEELSTVIPDNDGPHADFDIPNTRQLLADSPLRDQGLVEIPKILSKVHFDSTGAKIVIVKYQIRDDKCQLNLHSRQHKKYKCSRHNLHRRTTTDVYGASSVCSSHCMGGYHPAPAPECRECLIRSAKPEHVRITNLETSIDITRMINLQGNTIYEKVATISDGVSVEGLLTYGYLKLILCKILYGKFDLSRLRRRYHQDFMQDLSNSKYCNFIAAFDSLNDVNYLSYFKH